MEAPVPTSIAAYWERDVGRHALAMSRPSVRLWNLWPGRGWASVLIGCVTFFGLAVSTALIAWPARWLDVPTGLWAMFVWVPILLAVLMGMHIARVASVACARRQSDEEFVAACMAAGSSARVARAVRRALAKAYGVPPVLVASTDTGWTLSRFMETPCSAEVAAGLCERLGRESEGGDLESALRQLSGFSSVASFSAVVTRAVVIPPQIARRLAA